MKVWEMKNKFNFLQIANWLYVIRLNHLKNIKMSKEVIDNQIRLLKLIKEVINKKKVLSGIQRDFLKNLKHIKDDLNIKETK